MNYMYIYTQYTFGLDCCVNEDICRRNAETHHPEERMFYARSKERPNEVEEISNALGLPSRDQLHRVFLQILLNTIVRRNAVLADRQGNVFHTAKKRSS